MADRHTRTRVYGLGEEREEESFYERKKGVDGMLPTNHTVFREAERRFKAKKLSPSSLEHLDQVLNTQNPHKYPGLKLSNRICINERMLEMYELDGYDGLYLIPGALTVQEQKYWLTRAFSSFMSPPNPTNLDAHFHIPSEGLWPHWYGETARILKMRRKDHPDDSEQKMALPKVLELNRAGVADLLRRIRWVTLGYQYDWTTKEYDFTRIPVPFPTDLAIWSDEISQAAGFGPFKGEAGIVNFYQPGDTLTGHVDRSEKNMAVPLLSMSLGASCIYLLGGPTRDDPVCPIHLHSGDILIMSGSSRKFYHGVPRILAPDPFLIADGEDDPLTRAAIEILGDARVNINIRQVN